MFHTSSDTEEEGNISVEEVLTEKQEESEEISTIEVANEGEPAGPYEGEPIADEEWLAQYNEERQAEDDLLGKLQRRLDGSESIASW